LAAALYRSLSNYIFKNCLWFQDILKKVQYLSPGALIVDSIQTVYLKGIMGSPGGIMQVGNLFSISKLACAFLVKNL